MRLGYPTELKAAQLKPAVQTTSTTSDTLVATVLLVDDRDETRVLTRLFLSNFGYCVDSARSAEEGLAVFNPKVHDIVVTDNTMPGMTGAEMAHVIKMRSPTTPILMYTGMIPRDCSCLDAVIQRPAHLMTLKEEIQVLLNRTGSENPA
jgi:DNA-binding response OmpR family regulator